MSKFSKFKWMLEYVKTAMWTVLIMSIIIVITFAVIQYNVYQAQNRPSEDNDSIDYYLIGVLIDKNKYLESQEPKNYKINLKLGILYEIYKSYASAEAQFKLAIEKAPFDDFYPTYKLALLYIKLNRLDEAQKLMDDIDERPMKSLIEYKADIYNKLGDKYYASGDYVNAIARYQKSISYYKIVKSRLIPSINNSLASAYVYLAEQYVNQMDIDDAISCLESAIALVDAPILKYKLALLLVKSDPSRAYSYFEEVFKKEPSLINFDVYYSFLNEMAVESDAAGNFAQADLYKYKAQKFKDYYQENILSVNDVTIESADGEMVYNQWKKRYKINLELQLRNISDRDLNSLFVDVVFKDEDGIITDYVTQVVDKKQVLKLGQVSPIIFIKTFYNDVNYYPNKNVSAEISVSKLENSYKISLATIKVREVRRMKKQKTDLRKTIDNWLNGIKPKEVIHKEFLLR